MRKDASLHDSKQRLSDADPGTGVGARLRVDLRSGWIDGPLPASSRTTSLTNGFRGTPDFVFSSPVAVDPWVTYYFCPTVESGDPWRIMAAGELAYSGGMSCLGGQPLPGSDLWFREGIIVPKPAAGAVVAMGLALLVWAKS